MKRRCKCGATKAPNAFRCRKCYGETLLSGFLCSQCGKKTATNGVCRECGKDPRPRCPTCGMPMTIGSKTCLDCRRKRRVKNDIDGLLLLYKAGLSEEEIANLRSVTRQRISQLLRGVGRLENTAERRRNRLDIKGKSEEWWLKREMKRQDRIAGVERRRLKRASIRLYRLGLSLEECGRVLGIGHVIVQRYLIEEDEPRRNYGIPKHGHGTDHRVGAVIPEEPI